MLLNMFVLLMSIFEGDFVGNSWLLRGKDMRYKVETDPRDPAVITMLIDLQSVGERAQLLYHGLAQGIGYFLMLRTNRCFVRDIVAGRRDWDSRRQPTTCVMNVKVMRWRDHAAKEQGDKQSSLCGKSGSI